MTTRRKIGGMVPLERAAGSSRLPALDPKRSRDSDIARKYRALIGGRPRPRPRPETPFGGPSKYADDDENDDT
jgi:hypothetical protein